jgi:hypothetical protein
MASGAEYTQLLLRATIKVGQAIAAWHKEDGIRRALVPFCWGDLEKEQSRFKMNYALNGACFTHEQLDTAEM